MGRSQDTVAILVAAGRGERAGEGPPKQYRGLGGEAVIARALRPFLDNGRIGRVICAINPDHSDLYGAAIADLPGKLRRKLAPPIPGGATRQASVYAALEAATSECPDLCLIHDAARPFVQPRLIDTAMAAAAHTDGAIPGVMPTDTLKRVSSDGVVLETLARETLRSVQTPQAFRFAALLEAHRRAALQGAQLFTDDAQIAEWAGLRVTVFEGDPGNMKITHPGDFGTAEARIHAGILVSRTGTGFDVHAFGPGDHVWLGGIRIAHERGVMAHSDGDVVLHALTDAVLGGLCEGDIGTHFPPSDPQWKGASSARFLAYAAQRVRARGGVLDHLDATVMCEAPRIGPHREAIQARVAEIAGIAISHVSVKATTTEKLGFTGRGEGLAAQAAATIRLPEGS
jgi:2-C-methyl-D-erythritol 4-phosphate cytidylyltransferase/2-C-methyl-D-erythritol 2,4-cyclodiphosphate synthase